MTSPINREIALGIWIGCVALLWTCVIGVLLWMDISDTRQLALGEVRAVARGRFESYLIYMQSAYMTASFHESGREQQHITSLKPRRADNAPDAWELIALKALGAGAGEYSSVQTVHGESVLRYMGPVTIQNGCLQCHRSQGYSLGDVAGGISVDIPVRSTFVSLGSAEWAAGVRFGVVWIVGLCGLGFAARSTRHRLAQARQVERALREGAERYRTVLHSAMDGFWLVDAQGRLLEVNDAYCRMSGYSAEDLLGMSVPDLEVVEAAADTAAHIQKVLTTGQDRFQSRHRRKDGTVFDVEISVHHSAAEGRLVVFLCDITERKHAEEERSRLEAQLQQVQKMESVGRLAGGVAHDFNNMLGVIIGHAELALEQVDPALPLHADLQEIRSAATRSADLTGQLLAFARKQTVMPRELDLNDTVASMLSMLTRLIGENIGLQWKPGANLWSVKMDPSQLDQILANLCVNARDAISGVGTLTIETGNRTLDEHDCTAHPGCVPGQYVRLAVSDDGCGMDEKTLAHLFEPFFTTKEFGRGSGLGLASVYGAIRQGGGFIDVASEPNHGSTFTIYFPRHVGKVAQALTEGAATPVPSGHETILLVEDEPSILTMTKKMLEHQGYAVLAASTPGEATRLAKAHAGEIHLLMTDVVMPEMNGCVLAKSLLALYPLLKRLFMSGYPADVIANQGVLGEGVQFIQKPFTMESLATKVRDALDAPN